MIMKKSDINRIVIKATAQGMQFGTGVYEIEITEVNESKYRAYIPVEPLKEREVIKRINSTKKAEVYLNSNEGKSFVKARMFNL